MAKEKGKVEKLTKSAVKVGKDGKMGMSKSKAADTFSLGKKPGTRGEGGFKNKGMEHKR
ncbi:MAG: hypothetical protein ACHQ9S_18810 [Candidatus Binatia bacterium]